MKIFNDTLKNKTGIYSRKSLTALASFALAISYEFILPWFSFQTKEYVFMTLLGLTGATLGMTVWDKKQKTAETE